MATSAGVAVLAALAAGCAPEQPDTWEEEVPVGDPGEADERQPFLEIVEHPQLGAYVQTWRDEPLYLFLADSAGASTCYDECAVVWPPLIAEEEPTIDEPLDDALVGTVDRRDGARQVTYQGWPLYHFRGDSVPGRPQGQGMEDFGAEWYLVSPQGLPLRTGQDGGQAGRATEPG